VAGGDAIAICATGAVMSFALEVRALLAAEGVSAAVIDVPVLKPLPESWLRDALARFPHVVTLENHNVVGGLGSAIAELRAGDGAGSVARYGVPDVFSESCAFDKLFKAHAPPATIAADVVRRLAGRAG
jgi:transketolase